MRTMDAVGATTDTERTSTTVYYSHTFRQQHQHHEYRNTDSKMKFVALLILAIALFNASCVEAKKKSYLVG